MFNIREQIKVHNKYNLQLVNSITKEVKQNFTVENAVLDNVWNLFFGSSGNVYAISTLGLGSGTVTPTPSDTGLTAVTHTMGLGSSNTKLLSYEEEYPISTYTYQITVPATADYAGTFTEIGIQNSGGGGKAYWTHAFFEDSEGSPISIVKTDLDILIITYTVYVQLGTLDSNFHWMHPRFNKVNAIFRAAPSYASTPFVSASSFMVYSCAPLNGEVIERVASGVSIGSADTISATDRYYGITTKRLTTENGNGTYYQAIIFEGIGGITFPNELLFPARVLENIPVGTGDGVTTGFNTPLSLFVENSELIYVDGVKQNEGTDYTIKNASTAAGLAFMQPANFTYTDATEFTITKRRPLILEVADGAPIKLINRIVASVYYSYGDWSGSSYGSYIKHTETDSWAQRSWSNFGSMIVEYSNNGEDWVQINTYSFSDWVRPYENGYAQNCYKKEIILEEAIEAKYVRFSMDTSTGDATAQAAYDLKVPFTSFGSVAGLFYDDPNPQLVFTEAPAEGAIITMNAKIDRPYKTDQFVLDASMTLHFGDA